MEKSRFIKMEKSAGDTAVDGLIAGLAAGLAMAIFLALAGLFSGTQPLVTLGYFDPARAGNWVPGLLAHLAVSAIYGVIFTLLLRLVGWIRPSLLGQIWLWGMGYGAILYGLAAGVVFTAVANPLTQIAAWQMGAAHLLYGLILGFWLFKDQ
jgi:hypothetical protein